MTQSNRPPNLTPQDACRKAFEEWANPNTWFIKSKQPHSGFYADAYTQIAWRAWQAAYNRPKAEVDAVAPAKLIDAYCSCGEKMTISGNFEYTPCADVAGLVEKIEELRSTALMGEWMLDKCINVINQHFEVKP